MSALLEVKDLVKRFPVRRGLVIERTVDYVDAVAGVSFDIEAGKTLGLVGESGSGKSTTGFCILQLMRPTSGSVRFEGRELTELAGEDLRRVRRDAADRLPGPVLLARSPDDRGQHRQRAAPGAQGRHAP